MSLFAFLVIGLISGWIATTITEGHGLGVFRDILVGIVGAFIGGFVLSFFGVVGFGFWGSVVTSVLGAIIFLYIVGLFTHSRNVTLPKP